LAKIFQKEELGIKKLNEMILEVFNCHKCEKKIVKKWPGFYIWFSMFSQKYERMTKDSIS
jgi:hypothetical protein